MCGIFGFFLKRPLQEEDVRLGCAGVAALHHRGPDDTGYWTDRHAGVFVGHTRLSIIDLSQASSQPMVRQGAIISYNGELYNFRAVQDDLKTSGVTCSTTGDTEVLLQAWLTWGPQALDRFDGMFAFALYQDRQIHLVTDPFGEKPLYWAQTSEGIYFASEAGPLAKLLGLPPELTQEDLTAFLSFGFLPAPRTGIRHVSRVPPATHMVVERGTIRSQRRYWTVPQPVRVSGAVQPLPERTLDTLHGILLDSLRGRVYSDAPLGLFLSSGTDSSLVAAMTVKELGLPLHALTVAFPDGRDESTRATQIAQYLGIPHTVIDSREDPASVGPEEIGELYGELNANLTIASVRQMAQAASPYMKVALTGMGGDEMFYGYGRYQLLYGYRALFGLPASLRQMMARMVSALSHRRPMRTMQALCSSSQACRVLAVKNGLAALWLWGLPGIEELARSLFPADGLPLAVTARAFDLAHTMPASYIPSMERGSMRASLEVRTPYLSRQLLEALSQVDQRALIAFGQKSVLRRILARYLPPSLIDAPKQGFVFPQARFLNGLSSPPTTLRVVSRERAEEVWRRRSERNWQTLAVRLAVLEAWLGEHPAGLAEVRRGVSQPVEVTP